MSTWTFFGRILPQRVPLTVQKTLQGMAISSVFGEYTFRVLLHTSQAIVITDLLGYAHGYCFDVEVLSAVCKETNDVQVFGIEIPVLAERRKDQALNEVRTSLISAVGRSPSAQMVLADFREAMRIPIYTAFIATMQSKL